MSSFGALIWERSRHHWQQAAGIDVHLKECCKWGIAGELEEENNYFSTFQFHYSFVCLDCGLTFRLSGIAGEEAWRCGWERMKMRFLSLLRFVFSSLSSSQSGRLNSSRLNSSRLAYDAQDAGADGCSCFWKCLIEIRTLTNFRNLSGIFWAPWIDQGGTAIA